MAWAGVTLLLADTRWARRLSLAKRLTIADAPTGRSSESTGQWLARGATTLGVHMARVLGVHDDLATRLERVHSSLDSTAIRLRQVGWCIGGLALGLLVSAAVGTTPGLAVLLTLAPAALGFLLVEHRVTQASDAWRQRVTSELPVIAEQLAMLLGAGYALGPALGRLADRGQGASAQDLRRVLTASRKASPSPTHCGSGPTSSMSRVSAAWSPSSHSTVRPPTSVASCRRKQAP